MKKIILIFLSAFLLAVLIYMFFPTQRCGLGSKGEKCFCHGIMLSDDFCLGIKDYVFID